MQVLCLFLISLTAVCAQTLPALKHGKNVVCYVAAWSAYRLGDSKVSLEDLDPAMCTHIIYSFAGLDDQTNHIKSLFPWLDLEGESDKNGYRRILALKHQFPHLKVLLAVGGWDDGSVKYSNMVAAPESRAVFIDSVLNLLKNYTFDGIDLHWKYPVTRGGSLTDKENLVLLAKELSEAFKPHGYILTAALGASKNVLEASYDMENLNKYLDLINVLTYDYHGYWETVVGANAPLNGIDQLDVLSVTYTIEYMLSQGVSPNKIVLGLPIYGRTFNLIDSDTEDIEFGTTPADDTAFKGPYTREAGFIAYNEICAATNKSSEWVYNWHEQTKSPYLRKAEKLISYDNGRSIANKVRMAVNKGFAGVMVWTLDMDDVKGKCNETDTYIDFVVRYRRILNNPLSDKLAARLNLLDANQAPADGPSYVLKDKQLHLRLPQKKKTMFPFMQIVNDAISLSIEEKVVEEEMTKLVKENTGPISGKEIVCYLASWSVYRPSQGKFAIEDVNPALCTHLVYAFAGLSELDNSIISLDPWQDLEMRYGKAGFKRLAALKQKYPHLKVNLAIGGWSEASLKYSNMVSRVESRAVFINSALMTLENYNFDGLVMSWAYPTLRGGKPQDKVNFVLLVKEMAHAFKPRGYSVSVAVGTEKFVMDSAYDLARLSPHLDMIHMMSYDYHGSWGGVVDANAPLKGASKGDVFNVEYTIDYMISHGVAPEKLILGLPMYGRTFILANPNAKEVEFGSTLVQSSGFRGPYTGEDGFLGYNEICTETSNKSSQWVYQWHERSSTPYLRMEDKVISYDNGRSIASKVKLAIDKGLGGVMVWTIDTDDFKGNCNETGAYADFVERYQRMVNDPLLTKALSNLYLLDVNQAPIDGPSYVLKFNRLHLRLPQPKYPNYTLMQTINYAISLSIEEKRIRDEIARITKENEVKVMIEGEGGDTSVVKVFIVAGSKQKNNTKNPFFEIQQNISFRFD